MTRPALLFSCSAKTWGIHAIFRIFLPEKLGQSPRQFSGLCPLQTRFFYVYFIPMFASGPCYHPVVFRCSELCETTLHRGVKSKKQWGCQSTNEANHLASLFWSLCVSYHCSFLSVCPLLTCICLFGCIVLLLQTVLLWNSPSWILQTPNLPALCFLETMRVIYHIIPHLPGEGC